MSKDNRKTKVKELYDWPVIEDLEETVALQSNLIGELQVQVEELEEEVIILDARLSGIEEVLDKVRWAFTDDEDDE